MKRLFMIDSPVNNFLSSIIDTLLLNTLFIVFSIPLITVGSAATALHNVNGKIIRKERPYIIKTYIKAFKENFKTTTVVWILIVTWMAVLILNYRFLEYSSGLIYIFILSALVLLSALTVILSSIIFVYIGKFDHTLKGYILSSIQLLLVNPLYMIGLIGLSIIPWVVMFSTAQTLLTGIYILTFGGFSLLSLLKNRLTERLFQKYA